VVKTLASHAGIRGSTPLGDTKKEKDRIGRSCLFFCEKGIRRQVLQEKGQVKSGNMK
jgi:hypothetical protein